MKRQVIVSAMLMAACGGWAEVSPYAGLWVGTVGLTTVNEVSIPLDADNVPRAPDPLRPTLTGDRADLRLIIHVNAAGQASLLKDVAVINRNLSGNLTATLADIALAGSDVFALSLVTDPALYAEYPMQRATRFTSVVFDFGDAQATRVLDALVSNVVNYAVATVALKSNTAVDTAAKRNQIAEDIAATVKTWPMGGDNVAAAYQAFLDSVKTAIPSIAAAASPTVGAAGVWMQAAKDVAAASPFGDTRAMQLVTAVQAAGTANELTNAWSTAAALADTGNTVVRLLSSKDAGDALTAAVKYAAANPGATAATLVALPSSTAVITAALISKWDDKDMRAKGALDAMFAAVATAAAAGHAAEDILSDIQEQAYAAGRIALAEALSSLPAVRNAPTDGYTAFVTSAAYTGNAPEAAARASASAALIERVQNPLTYQTTMWMVAKAAAVNALQPTYAAAARVKLNELPLDGAFALGQGDARFRLDVAAGEQLGAAGLTGQIVLPANFPTNPFRHRRHPDHTTGFDITRNIRLDFDAPDAPGLIPTVTRGVLTVTGMYREEFFGLHKPLGQNQDVGLRTEGRFELNRISTIPTLNGK